MHVSEGTENAGAKPKGVKGPIIGAESLRSEGTENSSVKLLSRGSKGTKNVSMKHKACMRE